jgi:hypothetical protein
MRIFDLSRFVYGIRFLRMYLIIFLLVICNTIACVPSVSPIMTPVPSLSPKVTSIPSAASSMQNTHSLRSDDKVYLAVETLLSTTEGQAAQIWQISVDGASEKLIHQAPRQLPVADNDILLSDTVQKIGEYLRDYPDPRFPDIGSVSLSTVIKHLTLSSDDRSLAWMESYSWCPGNYCYGEGRIKVLQLNTGRLSVDHRVSLGVTSLAWTLDNQALVFSECFRELGDIRYDLKQFNIEGGEATVIGSGSAPVLSEDGQRLVVINRDPYLVSGLDIVSLSDRSKQVVTSPIWTFISDPAWSPDGLNIAFAGSVVNDWAQSGTPIYTVNLQTLDIITFTKNTDIRFFNNPHWSPDGNLIAADGGEDFGQWDHLVVLDSQSGKVVNDFVDQRDFLAWEWSDNSQSILLVTGSVPQTERKIVVFQVSTGNLTTLSMPEAIQNDLRSNKLFLSGITW